MLTAGPGSSVGVSLTLEDGNTGQYPNVQLVDSTGALIGSPIDLDHAHDGTYVGIIPAAPLTTGYYHLHFAVWADISRTIPSSVYSRDNEILVVETQTTEIASAVWDQLVDNNQVAGSFGQAIKILMGISAKSNMRFDNAVYDSNGFMTSARIRVFANSTDATNSTPGGTGENEIFTLQLTGTPDGTFVCTPSTVLGLGS